MDTEAIKSLRSFAIAHNRLEFSHVCQLALNGVDWAVARVERVLGSITTELSNAERHVTELKAQAAPDHRHVHRVDEDEVKLAVIDATSCEAPGGGLPKGFVIAKPDEPRTPELTQAQVLAYLAACSDEHAMEASLAIGDRPIPDDELVEPEPGWEDRAVARLLAHARQVDDRRAVARIEAALRSLGAELAPPTGWERVVLDAAEGMREEIEEIMTYWDSTESQDSAAPDGDREHRDQLVAALCLAAVGRDRELLEQVVREGVTRGRGAEMRVAIDMHRIEAAGAAIGGST